MIKHHSDGEQILELALLFFNDVEEHEFLPNQTSNGGTHFSQQAPEFYGCIQFEIRKRLVCCFAKL